MPSRYLPLISQLAAKLDAPLAPEHAASLCIWLDLLDEWNKRTDLTAARSTDELLDLCLVDAFVLARLLPHQRSVVDVGSGAGAPGLPLAILRPDLQVCLVEPLTKRVAFLRTVVGTLNLPIELQRCRSEQLLRMTRRWQVAISRATLEPAAWLSTGERLLACPDGLVAVLLARQAPPDSATLQLLQRHDYEWPCTAVSRNICLYGRPGSLSVSG